MKLSVLGRPSNERSMFLSPFKAILVGLIVVAGVHFSLARVINRFMNHKQGEDHASILVNAPSWVLVSQRLDHIMLFVVCVYLFVLVLRTRYHIRQTYNIPEQCCGGCEDCCCAYWCGFCTVSQMARHTADYHTYQPHYCSETGLGERAPPTLDATEV